MSDTSAIKGQSVAPQAASPVNSPSVTDTLKALAEEFPDLPQIIKASKTSVETGLMPLVRTTYHQEVATLATQLAKGETLTAEDLVNLKTIATDLTKKGSESAKVVLERNDKIKTDKYNAVKLEQLEQLSAQKGALTEKDKAYLYGIRETLYAHGSAELIQKYGETLTAADKAKFANAFTKSQKTETGFTVKYNAVFNMARKHAIATGGAPEKFMQGNTLYTALATTRVNQSTDRAKMEKPSASLMKSLEPNLSTKITKEEPLTLPEATQIVDHVSNFFKNSIATRTLSPEYVADLKALLAEVGTHFETSKKETADAERALEAAISAPSTFSKDHPEISDSLAKIVAAKDKKEIALTKFKLFTSSYMLQNLNPILAKNSTVGVYLSEITKRAASMQLYWPSGKLDLPESVNLPTAALNGINSLLTMGEKNGLFTSKEVMLIKAEVAELGSRILSFQKLNAEVYPELKPHG